MATSPVATALARNDGAEPEEAARQILLTGPDALWLVSGASVDLFAVDPGDRSPWQFLGELSPGAIIAGSPRSARHVLLGQLQVGSTLHELSVGDLAEPTRHPLLEGHDVAGGVDEALMTLHRAMAVASSNLLPVGVLGEAVTELGAGELAGCPDEVRWMTIQAGTVQLGPVDQHRHRTAGEVVVVAGDEVRAITDCRLVTVRTADLLHSGELGAHLLRQQDELGPALDAWIDEGRVEQERQLGASTTSMVGLVTRAEDRLRAVALPGSRPTTMVPDDTDTARAAQVACALVAEAIGAEPGQAATSAAATSTAASSPAEAAADPVLKVARTARWPARSVTLPDRWWRQELGPLVGYLGPDRHPVALLPGRFGYVVHDVVTGRRRVTSEFAAQLGPTAVMLYRKLPDEPLGGVGLARFALHGTRADQLRLFIGGLLAFGLGLGVPVLSGKVLGAFVPQGRADLIVETCLAVLVVSTVGAALSTVSSLALVRVAGRLDATVQAAVWHRLLTLPQSFFMRFSTGELANAAMGVSTIRTILSGIANVVFTSSMMAAANLGLMFWYSPGLGLVAILVATVHTVVFLTIRIRLVTAQRQLTDLEYQLSDQVFHILRGLPKLRVASAEGFAYAHWADSFARSRALSARVKRSQSLVVSLDLIYVPLGSVLLYALLAGPARGTLTVATFITFATAFASVLAAMSQITTAVATGGIVGPIFEKVKPMLEEAPEVAADTAAPGQLSGDIEMSGVSFRYERGAPLVLRDVSLRIRAGEFVAIVGHTGCGKSTLLRLLVGFNKPTDGSIRYDGMSLARLDVAEVRNQCGIVLQHSTPFAGTVLRNIVGGDHYSADDVEEAVRMAGLEKDVARMPLGLQTLLSDGGPELSGGQRQRLMIAQALIRRPRMLFFDEATSALDNITQSVVAENTGSLAVTRLVIAHRLSTIMDADRVVVMDAGRIVEQGAPDDLLADASSRFAKLVARQRR